MPEGMSAILRSHQPPEQRAQKRSRAEDSDSGGSTGRSRCRYHGCERPTREEGRGEFCGHTHKEFFMSTLADMLSDHGGAARSSLVNGMCLLPGCDQAVGKDSTTGLSFDFCEIEHYHEYIEICTRRWAKEGRLCKLRNCTNHVWVDETIKKFHKFCGKKCARHFFARRGLSSLEESPWTSDAPEVDEKCPSDDEVRKESTSQEAFEQDEHAKVETKLGYHDKSSISREYMEKCLRHLVPRLKNPSENFCTGENISTYLDPGDLVNADPSGKLCLGTDISKKHPWELNDSEGDEERYFLLMYDSKRKIVRTTKEHFAWKQDGPKYVQSQYLSTRYLHYQFTGEKDTSNDRLGGHIVAYRLYNAAKNKGQNGKKEGRKRWKNDEHLLSDEAIKEVTGGSLPRYRPRIWKIFRDKKGKPDWPPTGQDKEKTPAIDPITEDGNAVVCVGTPPDLASPGGGVIPSSISSNVPPQSDLTSGGETAGGGPETGQFCVPTFLEDDSNTMDFFLDLPPLDLCGLL